MKLGTDECKKVLLQYKEDCCKNEMDELCVDILISTNQFEIVDMIDAFIHEFPENEQNIVLLKIGNKIHDIREELGIEDDEDRDDEPITPDINDVIDIYKESLMDSLSALINNYKDNSQNKTLEEFCYTIERFIEGLNCIFLDSFKDKNTNINHGKKDDKKKELHNRMKANNLKIIK